MDGTAVQTTLEERRLECLLLSSTKVQKLLRKTRRNKGRHAEFTSLNLRQPLNNRQTFTLERSLQQNNVTTSGRYSLMTSRSYLRQHVDSPHVSRQWDHPIKTIGPMRRRRLPKDAEANCGLRGIN
jgi:phytoene dehydrogenase-like protein